MWRCPKLQTVVYDGLRHLLEEGARKRCSECGAVPNSKQRFTTIYDIFWKEVPESGAHGVALSLPHTFTFRVPLSHFTTLRVSVILKQDFTITITVYIKPLKPFTVQELCESRGRRPGLSVLTSLLVSVDVKIY